MLIVVDSSEASRALGSPPSAKQPRLSKLYACSQCSYSADKKVSLNRHMRMHGAAATPPSASTTLGSIEATPDALSAKLGVSLSDLQKLSGTTLQDLQKIGVSLLDPANIASRVSLVDFTKLGATAAVEPQLDVVGTMDVAQRSDMDLTDRYCTECDIKFSSNKTYRAHKAHYCQTRRETVKTESQPKFLALPTNPMIIVPYTLLKGASVLQGGTPQGAPCFVLPNGMVKPVDAQAMDCDGGEYYN